MNFLVDKSIHSNIFHCHPLGQGKCDLHLNREYKPLLLIHFPNDFE